MKSRTIPLKSNCDMPYEGHTDTKIEIEGVDLARVVGKYVEEIYGVTAEAVTFHMKRKSFGSAIAHTKAVVDVRK